jgi:hypothetical protein
MIKLREIITHLEEPAFKQLEQQFESSGGDKFLHLLRRYRLGDVKDQEIANELGISSNSLYVLKSRLNDKIQESLSGNLFEERETVLKQLHKLQDMIYSGAPEITEAFLLKLETDLSRFDMHGELMVVYSALKKLQLFSGKYYHYSQAYNRNAAFGLALEKCEEILGNFNKLLAEYDFSRAPATMEQLAFVIRDIDHHYQLSPSRQTEIMKNFAELGLALFTGNLPGKDFNVEKTLVQTRKIVDELPENSLYKKWSVPLSVLFFEFYRQTGQRQSALEYLDKINEDEKFILLYSTICLSGRFLLSKLEFENESEMANGGDVEHLCYEGDVYSEVMVQIYRASKLVAKKQMKEAANLLNNVINTASFKDYLHISIEVRLTLLLIYILIGEPDLAEVHLKSLSRKIKAEGQENYKHVLGILKVFHASNSDPGKVTDKQKDEFTLFMARNVGEKAVLKHLLPELKRKYA